MQKTSAGLIQSDHPVPARVDLPAICAGKIATKKHYSYTKEIRGRTFKKPNPMNEYALCVHSLPTYEEGLGRCISNSGYWPPCPIGKIVIVGNTTGYKLSNSAFKDGSKS